MRQMQKQVPPHAILTISEPCPTPNASLMPVLSLEDVHVAYGAKNVLNSLNFQIETGEIACLLGPSGCGKTTTLRAIAGFEAVSSGHVRLDGQVIACTRFSTPPHTRGVGMVFQDYALFPHLSASQNIAFGLRAMAARAVRSRVTELLDLVGLSDYANVFPHELSGGQQQRIALARALAPRPRLILLDEPFSSLDIDLRESLGQDVRALLKREHVSALVVTHDQNEAFSIGDMIGLMQEGRLEQWGTPEELYHKPANRFVANFIGDGVFISGTLSADSTRIETELGAIATPPHIKNTCTAGQRVEILLRPGDIAPDPHSPLCACIETRTFRGAEFLYQLRLPSGSMIQMLLPGAHVLELGQPAHISLKNSTPVVLDT